LDIKQIVKIGLSVSLYSGLQHKIGIPAADIDGVVLYAAGLFYIGKNSAFPDKRVFTQQSML
jgi:acid phosphatase class B